MQAHSATHCKTTRIILTKALYIPQISNHIKYIGNIMKDDRKYMKTYGNVSKKRLRTYENIWKNDRKHMKIHPENIQKHMKAYGNTSKHTKMCTENI